MTARPFATEIAQNYSRKNCNKLEIFSILKIRAARLPHDRMAVDVYLHSCTGSRTDPSKERYRSEFYWDYMRALNAEYWTVVMKKLPDY